MPEDRDDMEPTFSEAQQDPRRADSETTQDPELVRDRDDDGTADTAADADVEVDRSASERDEPLVDAERIDVDRDEADLYDRASEADTVTGTADLDDRPLEADSVTDPADLVVGADTDQRDDLMPGDMVAAPVGDLLGTDQASGLRNRWQELQLRFVDDPRGVVDEAQSLVGEAVRSLTTALTDQQRDLDGLAFGGNGDTEQLRVALQRYREFFDRVLGYGDQRQPV